MPQDAFTLRRVAEELGNLLTGGKVTKVNQPSREIVSLHIYTKKGAVKLDICLSAQNCGLIVTDYQRKNPAAAPNFCMLLRKHIQGAEITGVGQVGFERILYVDFRCFSEFEEGDMRLYCEVMGKYSNAVLTRDGVVVGALRQSRLDRENARTVFPGLRYVLPDPQEKADPTADGELEAAFSRYRAGYGDAASFLCDRVKGLARSTCDDIVRAYGEGLTPEDVRAYVNGGVKSPCVVLEKGTMKDFAVRSSAPETRAYPTLLEAQAAYYDGMDARRDLEARRSALLSALNTAKKKTAKRRAQIEKKKAECAGRDELRLKGELITANIYAIERGADVFEAVNYNDESGGRVRIELDRSLTPAQNAQRYYRKYAKLRRASEAVAVQEEENDRRSDYLDSVESSICAAECQTDLVEIEEELYSAGLMRRPDEKKDKKKRRPATTPYRRYAVNGFDVFSGRNNMQNDRLLKESSGADVWLHTKGYHSSFVIISTGGAVPPEETLLRAAEICAYHSGGRGGGKIQVDYTLRKYVKKTPSSPAGHVTYTNQRTLTVEPNPHEELMIRRGDET